LSTAVGPASNNRFGVEVGALLRLGTPMMVTQFFFMAMGFVDTVMAGRYGATDLAGVALGGAVMWPVFMLSSGLTMALTPIVAQLRGAGTVAAAGFRIRQGLWLALAASAGCLLVITHAGPLFQLMRVDPEVQRIAEDYLAAAAWGLPAVQLYVVLRYTCEGLGRTLPPMVIAGLALPVNAMLNYVLIYGHLGAPELGGVGCGWATGAVWWVELMLILPVLRTHYFRATTLAGGLEGPQWTAIRGILRIGGPIGLTVFLEMAVFSVVGLSVASLGVVPLAANSIAGNVNWATYVIPMTLGSAASIRVGYYVGAGDLDAAAYVARIAFLVSLAYAAVVSVLLVIGRHAIASLYTSDPAVLELATSLMLLIALYQIVDDTHATMGGTLRGYKDTRAPMVYALIGYWLLALPLGAVLCFGWLGVPALGVRGYWIGLTAGLAIVATCVGWRLVSTSRNPERISAFATL
jgi:MATE family multidrug resistance protein